MNVIVVGAGITGLCTGLALAKSGHQVTIVERDAPPPDGGPEEAFFGWNRRGAAQFRHPHAFLAVMSNLLEQSFPDLIEDFFAAGARKVTFESMLPAELKANYKPDPEDEKLWILMCRRATMETVFRRYAERAPGVDIRSGVNVTGLITDNTDKLPVVQGISILERGSEPEDITADIVVDAGGRNSKVREWLRDLGANIESEDDDAEIVYYTRHYNLRPGVEEPERDPTEPSTGDLGFIKFGVFPGDNGHFAVIVCIHREETELLEAIRDSDTYDEICRAIPGLNRWMAEDKAEATTGSFGFSDIHAVWHHYVTGEQPVALNYFAVGDAAVRTNPLYGRGCSTGIIHAHVLSEVLEENESPMDRALVFDRRTEEELRPIFKASLADDKRAISRARAIMSGDTPEKPTGMRARLRSMFGNAMREATRKDIHVMRGAMRTFNLMEKPGEFMKDWRVIARTLRFMGRGQSSSRVTGPSRDEILTLITSSTPQDVTPESRKAHG